MKAQVIFDTVVTHLMSQGRAAMGMTPDFKGTLTKGCAYRGRNKTACAFGCLIPDDLYDKEFEGMDVYALKNRGAPDASSAIGRMLSEPAQKKVRALFRRIGPKNVELVARLQAVHDMQVEKPWKRNKKNRLWLLSALQRTAADFNLKTSHLKAFEELTGVSKRAVS